MSCRTIALSALLLMSGIMTAHAAKPTYIDIPSQSLGGALRQLADQTGLQLAVETSMTVGKTAPAVKGDLTHEAALEQLLEGSGLKYKFLDSHTVAVSGTQQSGLQNLNVSQATQSDPAENNEAEEVDSAASSDADGSRIEEIVVTAQRRDENVQKVPISMSVLSGETLDASSARGTSDALRVLPSVQVRENFQTGGTTIAIRGVNVAGPLSSGASPVAYYLDTVPFGFVKNALVPDAAAYDLERIEVLRGPQGTLYGSSALNGVVRVLTHDANLNDFEVKGRAIASSTKDGGGNYRGDAAVNIPIVPGVFAIRAVAGSQNLSGWVEAPNRKDINDGEILNLRLKANAQPTEALSIGLSAWLSRTDYDAPSASGDDGTSRSTLPEPIHSDFDSFGLKLGYDFGPIAISSATSYLRYKLRSVLDLAPLGLPAGGFMLGSDVDADMFSQEVNFNSTGTGPWRWSGGVIYRDASDTITQLRHTPDGTPNLGYFRPSKVTYTSKSYAVYGELTRSFLDGKLDLTGGIRYFNDDVGLREKSRFDNAGTLLVSEDTKFDAVTPRAVLTARPSQTLNLYLSYGQGFRSGSPQNPAALRIDPTFVPAVPDRLHNFEFGTKGSLLDGAIAFDAAVYYIKWKDTQQLLSVNPCATCGAALSAFINAESMSGPGFEIGVTTRPFEALTLKGSFSVNDLTFDRPVIDGNGVTLYDKGDRIENSQKYTASGSADLNIEFGNEYASVLSANISYGSSVTSIAVSGGGTVLHAQGDPITLVGLDWTLEAPSGWSASLFVDNLTNERGSPKATLLSIDWYERLRPRTIGVQFEFKY